MFLLQYSSNDNAITGITVSVPKGLYSGTEFMEVPGWLPGCLLLGMGEEIQPWS